jgi:hypothetical protein
MTFVINRIVPFTVSPAQGAGFAYFIKSKEDLTTADGVPSVNTAPLVYVPCELTEDVPSTEFSIVFNPSTGYTGAARKKGIVGTVRLVAYVGDADKLDGLAVIQGLPGNLTAQAIKAAKRVQVKPAIRCGMAFAEPVELRCDFPSDGGARLIRF